MTRVAAMVLSCGLVAAGWGWAQEAPTITTHKVTDGIYMLEGQGGNIGVSAGEDGLLIIDTQYERMVGAIEAALGAIDMGELKWILNTHFHGDHTGGNLLLGEKAPIIAQTNVRSRLITNRTDLSDAKVRHGLPVITYDDSASVHFNGEEIKLVHYPHGHTDSDSVVYFTGSNVVHMGDHFFNGQFPFIDIGGGGTVRGYIQNVHAVLEGLPDDVKIIPGHGALATKADLRNFLNGIEDTAGIIEEKIKAGKDRKTVIDEGLPEKYDAWGGGFVSTRRWIGIVYQSLSGGDGR